MSDEKGLRPEYLVVLLCALEALVEQARSVAGKLQSLPNSLECTHRKNSESRRSLLSG